MQHSNCYSNVKSQYNKFEYGGYLIVKMDLVYKWPFSFFFFIEISNPFFPHLISTPQLFGFTKCSNPRLLQPPVYSGSKSMYVITFLWCPPQFIKKVLLAKYTCFPYILNALTWYEKETNAGDTPWLVKFTDDFINWSLQFFVKTGSIYISLKW